MGKWASGIWGLGFLLTVGLFVGCNDDEGEDSDAARWSVGLYVKATGTVEETVTSYKQVAGQDEEISTGTYNSGPLVGQAKGSYVQKTQAETTFEWMVVGEMTRQDWELWNEEIDRIPVSVVEERRVMNGTVTTEETMVEWDASEEKSEGDSRTINRSTTTHLDNAILASTYGWAGRDYVVRVDDLSLIWEPDPPTTFLTKRDANPGEFWVSYMGTTLYQAVGKDKLSIGGNSLKALQVEVRQIANVDTLNVADRCLREYTDSVETTGSGLEESEDLNVSTPTLHLDPNCTGNFVHRKIGNEWWYENTLVKEEATYYFVEINDWGYEWLREDGDAKVREVSRYRSEDVPSDARPFVEFTRTELTVFYEATDWEKTDLYALPESEDTGDLKGSSEIPSGSGSGDDDDDDDDWSDDDDDNWSDDDDDDDATACDFSYIDIAEAEEAEIGAACESGGDCNSGFCMTESTLGALLTVPEYLEIPNGYCSAVLCDTGMDSYECPGSEGGFCFSMLPLDATFADKGFCFHMCETDAQCRTEEGYTCTSASEIEGLTQEQIDAYYCDVKVCLNDSFKDYFEDALAGEFDE